MAGLLLALSRLALLMAAAAAAAAAASAWPPTAADRDGAAAAANAPNLVVVFADNLRYSGLSFGGSEVITANIDRMAAAGMKLALTQALTFPPTRN